jgi:hypothetical protein
MTRRLRDYFSAEYDGLRQLAIKRWLGRVSVKFANGP